MGLLRGIMKTTSLISVILLASNLSWAQRPMQPIAPPPRPTRPNNGNILAPSGTMVPSAPASEPYSNEPAANNPSEMDTNQPGATNPEAAGEPTNHMAPTNAMNPEMDRAMDMTNRLSVMAPAQVQAVVQVQGGLENLQQAGLSIGGAPSIQQAIHENDHLRQELQGLSGHIIGLARGPVRPSNDSVDRLSVNLLRACSHAHLGHDQQLVLSIVINLVVNCQSLSAAQVSSDVNNGVVILRDAGVPPALCNSFGCDLNSIALEVQPNLGI